MTEARLGGICRIALLALVATVTAIVLVPRRAMASTGRIVMTNDAGDDRTYSAWLLATADMGEGGHASNLAWAGNDMRDAVVGFVSQPASTTGATTSYSSWMSANGTPSSSSQLPSPALSYAGEMASALGNAGVAFSKGLASHVADAMGSPTGTASTGVDLVGSTGYWLVAESDANGIVPGATPVLVPMTEGRTFVTDKSPAHPSSVPTLAKHAIDPSATGAASTVDAGIGETVAFSIESRLPSDIADRSSYHMRFADILPEGLSLVGGDTHTVSVKVGTKDVTGRLTGAAGGIALSGNVLTVDMADLVGLVGGEMALSGETVVTVRYETVLGTGGVIGGTGNRNSVRLTYSTATGEATTEPATAQVVSYKLEISKSDSKDGKPLPGAGFTVQAVSGGVAGDYMQADGTCSSARHEFMTGADGKVTVLGIGTGAYQVTETTTPEGYAEESSPISVTVSATHPATGMGSPSLSLTVSGRNATAGASDATAGIVRLLVTNKSTASGGEDDPQGDDSKDKDKDPSNDAPGTPDGKGDDKPGMMDDLARDVRDTAGRMADDIRRGDMGSLVQTGAGFIGRRPVFGVLAAVAVGSLVASAVLRGRKKEA